MRRPSSLPRSIHQKLVLTEQFIGRELTGCVTDARRCTTRLENCKIASLTPSRSFWSWVGRLGIGVESAQSRMLGSAFDLFDRDRASRVFSSLSVIGGLSMRHWRSWSLVGAEVGLLGRSSRPGKGLFLLSPFVYGAKTHHGRRHRPEGPAVFL